MCGTGGLTLTYTGVVYLALHADLIRARRCRDALDALEIGAGKKVIPPGWFRWLTDSPREAAELELAQAQEVLRHA